MLTPADISQSLTPQQYIQVVEHMYDKFGEAFGIARISPGLQGKKTVWTVTQSGKTDTIEVQ